MTDSTTYPGLSYAALALGTVIGAGTCLFADDSFTVNELGGAGVDQTEPVIVGTSHGALLVHEDGRAGSPRNFRARPVGMNGSTYLPSVSLDNLFADPEDVRNFTLGANQAGDSVLMWQVGTLSSRQIVRLDPETGEPIGYVRTIMGDEGGVSSFAEATVTMADDGTTLLLYGVGINIYGRLYSKDLTPMGPSFQIDRVDSNPVVKAHFFPDGSFMLAWIGLNTDIYAEDIRTQRFNADGTPDGQIYIYTNENTFFEKVVLGVRPDGSGLVGWQRESGVQDIYAHEFDTYGVPTGSQRTLLGSGSMLTRPGDVWPRSDGGWALVQDKGWWGTSASIVVFDEDLNRVGYQQTFPTDYPTSAWLADSESILVCWQRQQGDQEDIGARVTTTDTIDVSDVLLISDDVDGADQYSQALATDGSGRAVVVWMDERSGSTQVYMQRYDEDGNAAGLNQYVGDSDAWDGLANLDLHQPDVAMNASGQSIVIWNVMQGGVPAIMAQRFDADGTPMGYAIDATEGSPMPEGNADVALFDDGGFIVAWHSALDDPIHALDDVNIHVRTFDSSGSPIGSSAPRINSLVSGEVAYELGGIVARSDSSALIVYSSDPAYSVDLDAGIEMREVAADGSLGEIRVLYGNDTFVQDIAVGGDDTGFSVAWRSLSSSTLTVRHYDAEEEYLRTDSMTDANLSLRPRDFSFGSDGSRYLLWEGYEYRSSADEHVYEWSVQRYDRFGAREDASELVRSMEGVGGSSMFYDWERPEGRIAGSRFLMSYSAGSGTDQGWDVNMMSIDVEICMLGDFNCDGRINGFDLSRVLGYWGLPEADLDGDGVTTGLDLALLLGNWTG